MKLFRLTRAAACRLLLLAIALPHLAPRARADNATMDDHGVTSYKMMNFGWVSDPVTIVDEWSAAGIKWVRVMPEWHFIETDDNVWDAARLTRLDDIVNRCQARGINLVLMLGFTADWASSMKGMANSTRYPPADWTKWERYVNTLATRYNNKVKYWEVWNEPDQLGFWRGTTDDFKLIIGKAHDQIKLVNATNKVLLAGFSGELFLSNNFAFVNAIFSAPNSVATKFDILAWHHYGDLKRMLQLNTGYRAILTANGVGTKPSWITEAGFTGTGLATKEFIYKPDRVVSHYLNFKRLAQVEKIFWFDWFSTTPPGDISEENFGLVLANDAGATTRTPRQAFYAYQATNGAETDFAKEKQFPAMFPTYRTLTHHRPPSGDGSTVSDFNASGSIRRVPAAANMYFKINDYWLLNEEAGINQHVFIDVTYQDVGTGSWELHYDAAGADAYKVLSGGPRANTGEWLTRRFEIHDANFNNRQTYGSDFRLRANGNELLVASVIVRKDWEKARVRFGTTNKFEQMEYRPEPSVTTQENYTAVTTQGGENCRQIVGNSGGIYLRILEGAILDGDRTVTMGIRFWDSGTDSLRILYNSTTSIEKVLSIPKTNTNQWRYVETTVTDARFQDVQVFSNSTNPENLNSTADLRIDNGQDGSSEYVTHFYAWYEPFYLGQHVKPYDPVQAGAGTVTLEDNRTTLKLDGNAWRSAGLVYPVTPATALAFDYKSTATAEIAGIGLDEDGVADTASVFQLAGSETYGIQTYRNYTGSAWKSYTIPAGTHYTGFIDRVTFVNDKDAAGTANGYFRNVRVFEWTPFQLAALTGIPGQDSGGTATVQDAGARLQLVGNTWKKWARAYTVTTGTVLEFEFRSTSQAEVHSIGLCNGNVYAPLQQFTLYGSQADGGLFNLAFKNYQTTAGAGTGTAEWKRYVIPVGKYYQGAFTHVLFTNDNDAAPAGPGTGEFRNVELRN